MKKRDYVLVKLFPWLEKAKVLSYERGEFVHAVMYHDDDCAVYKTNYEYCDCDPDFELLTDSEYKQHFSTSLTH